MTNINPGAHGNYSQGGFKGKASKKNAKWVQKGGNRPSKNKSCCSIAAGIRSIKDGNLRLGMRYFRMTPRYIARRFA